MTEKRKRIVVPIETKLKAIGRVERGETLQVVASDLKVGRSTVADWVKSKDILINYAAKPGRSESKGKVMKTSKYEELNEAVFVWFIQQRNKGVPMSGPAIKEKAKMFAMKLGEDYKDFLASDGWLGKWKSRFRIRQLVLGGEQLSTDDVASKDFKLTFLKLTEGYTRDQIFNCDETELNYKMLPTESIAARSGKTLPGYKRSKERVTVLLCCNASGEFRLPLMCIGKSRNPSSLMNVNINALPVYYRHHKSAWMSVDLFIEWFQKQFVPKVVSFLETKKLPPKAILFLDNAPSHPDLNHLMNGDIVAYFLPPNVTRQVQPIDQGVAEAFKRNYIRLMLQFVVSSEWDSLLRNLEAINIKDAIYWAAEAWNLVNNTTLKGSWRNIYDEPIDNEDDNTPDLTNLVRQVQGCENVNESEVNQWWIKSDPDNELNVDEILEVILTEPKNEESEDECIQDSEKLISPEEGFQALDVALKFVEQHQASTSADVMLIRHWRDLAARERMLNKKNSDN